MTRIRDQWIVQVFERLGYRGTQLKILNRVRVHQQVLFVSDVLYAGGRYLEKKYLELRH